MAEIIKNYHFANKELFSPSRSNTELIDIANMMEKLIENIIR